ncbi:MAG: hypothetical protein HYS13_20250 [Planctomycetia bacterium]|nr:hypothetical protein [Planctomycetia bacterium]
MSPDDAVQLQIEIYRRMTGEERLKIGTELFDLSCDVARDGIHHQFPEADAAEVERRLRERLGLPRKE